MKALFRSWWRQISQRRVVIAVTTAIIMIAIASIIVGYWFDVTGFNESTQVSTIRTLSGPTAGTITRTETYQPGKTLWDWMQLLFIPVVLAAAGFWFNHRERKAAEIRGESEREIEQQRAKADREVSFDNQREAALKEYIDKLSELLLEKQLRDSKPEDEAYTQDILKERILDLDDADLSNADLRFMSLQGIKHTGLNLQGAILEGASLDYAHLRFCELKKANMSLATLCNVNFDEADFTSADLRSANMILASLCFARLNDADLRSANLEMANLRSAELNSADLRSAKLNGADLRGVDLRHTHLDTNLNDARLDAQTLLTEVQMKLLNQSSISNISIQ